MNRDEATELLDFWYNRQQNSEDVTFEFYGWWSKADKEVKPPVAKPSQADLDVLENCPGDKNSGGRGKRANRTQKKTGVAMDDASDMSDEDDIRVSRSKPTKNRRKSKSQVSSGESVDEFKASSDESSDDEIPAVKKSKATVKDKRGESRRRNAVAKRKTILEVVPEEEEDRRATGGWTTEPTQKANVFIDQSASRAPPTPLDNPRRVGPASRPGGALKRKPGVETHVSLSIHSTLNPLSIHHPTLIHRTSLVHMHTCLFHRHAH
ncbi:hypothetical protein CY34DRAFT_17918 [Suillus luteus UH-Slu-Lm8-n1]|uniref:Uncharacterized protein n=1 Tax=Suillus luteus UH-Slu-Lm8-n1 TaxID=930992 RepID=A0A0D0AQ89_9AGAM|nr:hypothetical protein CY34DRAFT_17918 [Suillus luteus UH-Slu-Lm8-n1]